MLLATAFLATGPKAGAAASTTGGQFLPYQATSVGSWPEATANGDVTGDGRNDVVMTTSYYFDPADDFRLWVFAQAANGSLLPPVSYPTAASYGNWPDSVTIGDITGDGRPDVAVGIAHIGVQVFPQLASGALGAPTVYSTPDSDKIRLGQLNGDGRLDVAGVGQGTNTVSVLYNDGAGGLTAPVSYSALHGGYDDFEIGDVTGDGRGDLIVMSGQLYADPSLSVLPQLAGGGFGAAAPYSIGSNMLANGIGVGDVTGDGRNDVVVSFGGNRPSSFMGVLPQTAAGTLGPLVSYASYDIPEPVEVADVNGDGRADVVTLHDGWLQAGVYLQQPDGMLGAESLYPIPSASYNPHGLAVGDVDGNGSNDIALADYNHGLVVLRNVMAGAPPTRPGAPTLTSAAAGNSRVDLAWSAPTSDGGAAISGYRIYRGTAAGQESLLASVGTVASYTDASAANGTTYYYEVSAVNSAGEGGRSNELSAKPTPPDTTRPSKPGNLRRLIAGTGQLVLDWTRSTDNVRVAGYRIFRSGVLVATVAQTDYLDSGLNPGTSYTYVVRAIDAAGNTSLPSSTLSVKTPSISSGTTGTLGGAIFNRGGGPLANAVVTVTLSNGSTTQAKTNGSGVWKISNLAPGTYPVGISLTGYQPQTLSAAVAAGATTLVVANLVHA